jgi:hypothetical protein
MGIMSMPGKMVKSIRRANPVGSKSIEAGIGPRFKTAARFRHSIANSTPEIAAVKDTRDIAPAITDPLEQAVLEGGEGFRRRIQKSASFAFLASEAGEGVRQVECMRTSRSKLQPDSGE